MYEEVNTKELLKEKKNLEPEPESNNLLASMKLLDADEIAAKIRSNNKSNQNSH